MSRYYPRWIKPLATNSVKTYRVTPKAERDLLAIGQYTLEKWGVRQRDIYLQNLVNRFTWLCEHPNLGANRDDIKQGYLSYHEGKHLIFYVVSDEFIDIIGVLHERMDFQSAL